MLQFPYKIIATRSCLVACVFAYCLPLSAQEHFIGELQQVNRVIKLRSQSAEKTALNAKSNATSRGDVVDRTTKPVANPNQIRFDEIDVPRALQDQLSPVVRRPDGSSVRLRPPSQISFSAPSAPAVSEAPTANAPESVNVFEFGEATDGSFGDSLAKSSDTESTEPSMTVVKRNNVVTTEIQSPKSVNVNQRAQLEIHLRNEGSDTVDNVTLIATLPEHAKFVSASPKPTRVDGRVYEFDIARLGGDRTQQVVLNIIPKEKTALEIGTQIRLENTQRTMVSVKQPELVLKIDGPKHSTIGQTVTHELSITNVGDGTAHEIRLDSLFPAEMRQTRKSCIDVIPSILPGRTLKIPYEARALEPGQGEFKVTVDTETTETQHATFDVTVYQPELRLSAVGPKLNFVERDGIYTINVDNTGEVEVTDVRVSLAVPEGLKVTTISRQAAIDAEEGTLIWMFDSLAAKSSEQIQLKATAVEEGQQVCNIVIQSNETLVKEFRLATQVTTRADLKVSIKNMTGPVQVGGRAEFLVEVENMGSRQANEINVSISLPESLMPVKDEPNGAQPVDNGMVFNEPHVAPGEKVSFRFAAIGVTIGEQVVRSTLEAAGSKRKVISEDSVFVYDVDEARVSESLSPVKPR
jgi:uncharacterized repeat protein (TIGR01451 family)